MDYFSTIWIKSIHLFSIPNTVVFLGILLFAFAWRALSWKMRNNQLSLTMLLLGLATWYFGILAIFQLLIVFTTSYIVADRVLHTKDHLLTFITGLISYIQILSILVLIFNFSLGYYITMAAFIVAAIFCRPKLDKIKISLSGLNTLDWTFIFFAIIFGSIPQSHWDAVYANLYISKWYVLSNSVAPIREAITSLFPQGATLYYSLFYKIGGLKMLQLSFLLPSLLSLLLIKSIVTQTKLKLFGKILIYASIFTPIFLFQATNGYYDNLVLLLLLSAAYTLFLLRGSSFFTRHLLSAFFIGFAASVKYFPLVMIPIIFFHYLFSQKITLKIVLPIISILIISFGPLTIWLTRSYAYTGSPIFPFFQAYFPTPQYWNINDPLEANPMIQTTMGVPEWLRGGFLTYPLKSYLKSSEFIEGTKGYPSIIYLILIPFQIFLLIMSLGKIIKKNSLLPTDKFFLASFLMYFSVGLVVRYYRYIWPFQFLWFFSSVAMLSNILSSHKKLMIGMTILVVCALPIQFVNLIDYYRYYPLDYKMLFQPDFYLKNSTSKSPILFINSHAVSSDRVLDGSQQLLPRLQLVPRVYQCNWYWRNWSQAILDPINTMAQFRYIIVSDDQLPLSNYCRDMVETSIFSNQYSIVYQDGTYAIYEKIQK